MDCFVATAPRNDVGVNLRDPAARMRPSCAKHSAQEIRGRKESRVPVAPIASRANLKKHTSVVTTGSPVHPCLPCAMVLTLAFALSLVTGLSWHHRKRDHHPRTSHQRRDVR